MKPQVDQKAVVVVDGQEFSFWTSVQVERAVKNVPSTMILQTYESSPGGLPGGWTTVHLMLGSKAECYLAEQLALTGEIDVRQVLYNKGTHEVMIRVGSYVTSMLASTVDPAIDGQGGQFVNQNLQQIAQAIGKNVQVNIEVQKAIGADIPFDRVSVPIGQTRWDFLAPLAATRNLHAIDDKNGYLIYARPAEVDDPSGFSLVEGPGGNILEARAIMRSDLGVLTAKAEGQAPGSDDQWPTNGIVGIAHNNNYKGRPRPFAQAMPQPGQQQEAQMFADHLMSVNSLMEFSVDVTVQGWLAPDGSLWIDHVFQSISLFSPMIMPLGSDYATLTIAGVKCNQSSEEGTTTTLSLCLPQGLGASGTLLAHQFPTGGP